MEQKEPAGKHPEQNTAPGREQKNGGSDPETLAEQPTDAANTALTQEDITVLHKLADYMERVNLADYVRLTQTPKRLIGINFLSGISRGFGMAVGFTLLGALAIYILNQLNVLNLPVIGDFIAKILEYVDISRGMSI